MGREHHLARPFCAGNLTLFGLHLDEKNLKMKFSLSIGHYFNITHATCVAGNLEINLETKERKEMKCIAVYVGFILCAFSDKKDDKLIHDMVQHDTQYGH